nr:carboxypeptidase-like regulatory domain-containing protein [Sunxiuqinia sp.]
MGLKRLLLFCLLANTLVFASAQTGAIKGTVVDIKTNETLIGATIYLEGTSLGTTTDFDGNYVLEQVPAGTYRVRCSYISYETKNRENVAIEAGGMVEIHFQLGESTVELGDVRVVAKANRESEAMLLLDQKEASGIKESIGSNRMSSMGVSNAASATAKISGVTRNESSGDVYVRGLGDRYLTTTMNGLPIPSDDVEKKNIDLNLFSADVIENVGIDKTFSVASYAD